MIISKEEHVIFGRLKMKDTNGLRKELQFALKENFRIGDTVNMDLKTFVINIVNLNKDVIFKEKKSHKWI
jgi:hypothetical protein